MSTFLEKIRQLPEEQKHTIFFTIIVISTVVAVGVGIILTDANVRKITNSVAALSESAAEDTQSQQVSTLQSSQNTPPETLPETQTTTPPLDWQMYANNEYGFSFTYPKDWVMDTTHSTSAHLWFNKKVGNEEADIYIEAVSNTRGINSAEKGIDDTISKMGAILEPKKEVTFNGVSAYEAQGTLCSKFCTEPQNKVYTPFSILYFPTTHGIIEIQYMEGFKTTGWKKTMQEWHYGNEFESIKETFKQI